MNLIRPRNLTGQAIYVLDRLEGVRPLLSVIEYAKELEPVARYLFGRVVLADDIEKGLEFMKESKWAAKVVTMNGESIEPGGAISGGDPPRQESLFQRKRELHDLAAGEKTLISGLSVVAGKKESVRSSMDLLTAKIETLREDYALTESDIAGLAGSISRCSSEITSLAGQISQKSSQISPLEAAESDLVLKINELQERK